MCDQVPDEVLLGSKRVAIELLPLVANEFVAYAPDEAIKSTAHVRGYVACWALVGEKLYLVETKGCYRIYAMGPVFADWVSETIRPTEASYAQHSKICVGNGVVKS